MFFFLIFYLCRSVIDYHIQMIRPGSPDQHFKNSIQIIRIPQLIYLIFDKAFTYRNKAAEIRKRLIGIRRPVRLEPGRMSVSLICFHIFITIDDVYFGIILKDLVHLLYGYAGNLSVFLMEDKVILIRKIIRYALFIIQKGKMIHEAQITGLKRLIILYPLSVRKQITVKLFIIFFFGFFFPILQILFHLKDFICFIK